MEVRQSAGAGWSLVGHEWVVDLLQRIGGVDGRSLRHAYLFCGPPQVGKSSLARFFATLLLCTGSDERPCGLCRSCRLLGNNAHADLRVVLPTASDGTPDRVNGLLRVNQAQEIVHEAQLRPLEGRYRIFLLQDAHRANDSFLNRLLKTIEEPPAQTLFLITAQEKAQLLPTIVSRCQLFDLRPVPHRQIETALVERWGASPQQATLLARLSDGRMGYALHLLQEESASEKRDALYDQMKELTGADRIERLAYAQRISSELDKGGLSELLRLWTSWWRDVMLAQAGCVDFCTNIDRSDQIRQHAERFRSDEVRRFLHTLTRIEGYLQHTVNKSLALDLLLLRLPRIGPSSSQVRT